MARTKQCARKTGDKTPQPKGAKAKARYFDAGQQGNATSTGTKAKKASNVTSDSNNQATQGVREQQRAIEPPLGWIEDRTGAPIASLPSRNPTSAAPKSKAKNTEPSKDHNRKSGKALAIRKSVRRNRKARKRAAALEKVKRVAEKRKNGKEKKKKEGRKDQRKESDAGGADRQGGDVEAQAGEAEEEDSTSREDGENGEEEGGARPDVQEAGDRSHTSAQTQPSSHLTATPAQALNLEVDGILNVVEPVMRDIFRAQTLAQASNTSFAAASPSPDLIKNQLAMMRSIVEVYEARGEERLTRYQAYALQSARLGLGELEYMRRSDEEQGEAAGATSS